MRWGSRGGVCLLTAAALAWAGCGDGTTGTSADRAPEAPSAWGSPPGSPLPDGFVVAEGSRLIGGAIPAGVDDLRRGEAVVDRGWTALLVVDGNAEQVTADYVAQAEAQGLVERQPPEMVTPDGEPIVIGPPGHTWARCAGDADRGNYGCAAHMQNADPANPRSFSIELTRGGTQERPLSHAVVRYATIDLVAAYGGAWGWGAFGDPAAVDPGPPSSWPTLPSAGESFSRWGEDLYGLTVEPGSIVAGPPFEESGDVVVLEVTDDPAVVLDAYRSQFEELIGSVSDVERVVVDADTTVDTVNADAVGGSKFELYLVQRRGERPWLVIWGSYD